ncbi:MAG: M15 family metallopeptidase [Clostridiales bacterium]|nr:M15 family metallopeptidase [Clostridiales bacterium]
MRKVYNKCGVTILCCLSIVLTSCGGNRNKESDSNYVIQEINPTKEPGVTITEKQINSSNKEEPTFEVTPETPFEEESMTVDSKEALKNLGSVVKPSSTEVIDEATVQLINDTPAKSIIKVYTANAATLSECFMIQKIPVAVYNRMENKSYSEGCTTNLSNLRYVRVLHYGFDGEVHIGELVVNQLIAEDIVDIFKELFDAKYPIEQMVLVDDYDADDNASMEANNTSSFNYRMVEGTTKLSNHAYGLAIDINPLYNPYVRTIDGKENIVPENGTEYANRDVDCEYYIKKDDIIYQAFIKRGFTWGGDWTSSKDYQHFQKVFE